MWLLKLHFSISFLLILTCTGFIAAFKDKINSNLFILFENREKHNGFLRRVAGRIKLYFLLCCPIINICLVPTLFLVIFADKNLLQELKKKIEKENE